MSIALINGKIYTMDARDSIVEALAIDGDCITRVGTTRDVLASRSIYGRVIELDGKTVLPGFIDGHTHLGHSGLESLWVDLTNTESTAQILDLIQDRLNKTPKGKWVVGVMYDDAGWKYQECLTKEILDELSTEHPIFLRRVCGHYGVVNTLALGQIGEDWKYVDRETGVLLEDSVLGFMKIIKPELSLRIEGIRKELPNVYSLGLTAVREIVNFQSIKAYRYLEKNNDLKLRVFGYIIYDDLDEYFEAYPEGLRPSQNLNVFGVKIFLDGSLGARTAALNKPYSDEPDNNGILLNSDLELKTKFERIKGLELSIMAHAIGDRAVQQFVEVYNEVFTEQIPANPKGHSIEHIEVIDDGLLSALQENGVFVSAQPNFAGRWSGPGGLNEQRLGNERLARCNAYREFIEKDIPLIFGSDSMPLGPLFGLKSAMFHPIQALRIAPVDAVKAYVQNCYTLLKSNSKFGIIAPGLYADLVILSDSPFSSTESDFDKIKVIGTIINGEIVYSDGL